MGCFALNGNDAKPEILGVPEIIRTYQEKQQLIGLGGPTLLAPLLRKFRRYIKTRESTQSYYILLLLTEGAIEDMLMTIHEIVELSFLPCSIIIVGVGSANFDNMKKLDSDKALLRDEIGRKVARDIVQFVEFNQSIKRGNLAEEVLKEVPAQLVSYMTMK